MGQLHEDLRKFWQRCETYKSLALAIADDHHPPCWALGSTAFEGRVGFSQNVGPPVRCMERAIPGCLRHWCCHPSSNGLWGGANLLQALNNAGCLPSYDARRRHVEVAPHVRSNEPPSVPWLLDALSHIKDVLVWHLCIDESHVEDVISVSREALVVGLCATCCRHPMPFPSGDDVEAPAQRLEQDPETYHAAN